jgi:recombination protein RecA
LSAAAQLRVQIENSLSKRIPSALTPQARRERPVLSTGIAALDELLTGGLPVGAITEIVGAASAGRTTVTLSFLANVMSAGQVCAWIDASDSFDPESAAANGLDLDRLLWVRCGDAQANAPEPAVASATKPAPAYAEPIPSGGSPHPRSETRGMPEAVESFLQKAPHRDKSIGTPGAPNRAIVSQSAPRPSASRQEQVAFDRLPARRGELIVRQHAVSLEPRCAEPQRRERPGKKEMPAVAAMPLRAAKRPVLADRWKRLDQALRATDLLMQAGGFGAVVLDLGDIPAEAANRIPLATWFRYRSAADRTRTAFVLLTRYACAQSSAEVLLKTSVSMPETASVMGAIPFAVELVRQRFRPETNIFATRKKPPQRAAAWSAQPAWVRDR